MLGDGGQHRRWKKGVDMIKGVGAGQLGKRGGDSLGGPSQRQNINTSAFNLPDLSKQTQQLSC